jgi:hypothetical protein
MSNNNSLNNSAAYHFGAAFGILGRKAKASVDGAVAATKSATKAAVDKAAALAAGVNATVEDFNRVSDKFHADEDKAKALGITMKDFYLLEARWLTSQAQQYIVLGNDHGYKAFMAAAQRSLYKAMKF